MSRRLLPSSVSFSDKQLRSELRYKTHGGYGSADTKIPYYTTQDINVPGKAMTATTNDSTNGLSITINEPGIYACTVVFNGADGGRSMVAITVNASAGQMDTSPSGIGDMTVVRAMVWGQAVASNNGPNCCSWTGYLTTGDVIRPHTDGAVPEVAGNCAFHIIQLVRM